MTVTAIANIGAIWMELHDPRRLRRLMKVQGITQRELSEAAGWRSHSYLGRLLRGQVKTLETDPALRIAHKLGVGVEDLFLTKVSSNAGHFGEESRTKKEPVAA